MGQVEPRPPAGSTRLFNLRHERKLARAGHERWRDHYLAMEFALQNKVKIFVSDINDQINNSVKINKLLHSKMC